MKRVLFLMMSAALITACGGGTEPATETTNEPAEAAPAPTEETEAATMEVEAVTLNLQTTGEMMTDMAYSPNRLSVPAGAEVTLILENTAESAAMIHNAVIIEAGKQTEVAEAALAAGPDNDYLPESDFIIAATPLANPGETVEVTFTAPEKKGTYQFICTYPGHTAMKGIFMVK